MQPMTEPDVRAALERCPRELHPLLLWLVTGQTPTGRSAINGTA
jgi:hypothetical protein